MTTSPAPTCTLTAGVLPWEAPTFIPVKDRKPCGTPALRRQVLVFGGTDDGIVETTAAPYDACPWHAQLEKREAEVAGEQPLVWTRCSDPYPVTVDEISAQADAWTENERVRAIYYVPPGPRCQRCNESLPTRSTGRPARFCSTRCRVAAHRAAKVTP